MLIWKFLLGVAVLKTFTNVYQYPFSIITSFQKVLIAFKDSAFIKLIYLKHNNYSAIRPVEYCVSFEKRLNFNHDSAIKKVTLKGEHYDRIFNN
ncbi:hypothetical protein HMPREF9104_01451 [Lentilactobacillus kisonensis F0435]|uniref:Uncharacterized protein n=1 Tax=Lentilactobacillus kisonensis F0435 TaxID=797516 RepID=H1LFS4_9LACO|nr:hypothetical protein HMPREF9104_01451 [Lentilactobacillus kisonensis F0435]